MSPVRRPVLQPMLAVAGDLPTDPDGWATEMKWDGIRALAYLTGEGTYFFSRNGRDISAGYPELASLARRIGVEGILDGEIVAFDDRGRPDFSLLQQRMHVTDRRRALLLAERVAVHYLIFDLLEVGGSSLLRQPYTARRRRLEALEPDDDHVAIPPAFHGHPADGMAASAELGLEGVVCKRLDSIYTPGRRSPAWRKVKHRRTEEVLVVGWEPGQGSRAGRIGALLLGVPDDGGVGYIGQVGSGFDDAELERLERLLGEREIPSPAVHGVPRAHARAARWVRPDLVAEIVVGGWSRDRRVRQASWRGLRPDKTPDDLRR
ncbi:MAG: non-homologous end-joining DNA ligase [Acidothermus sp.]|nr:non-homologous end-joining DNA ligase [Acidothermus sp.]